jgi:CHAT domain-containing protein/Tfp pilus assembly protein PilF
VTIRTAGSLALAIVLVPAAGFAQDAGALLARARKAVAPPSDYATAETTLRELLGRGDLTAHQRADALQLSATIQVERGRPDEAERLIDEAEALARGLNDPALRVRFEVVRGSAWRARGAALRAIQHYKVALEGAERIGSAGLTTIAYTLLSSAAQILGDWGQVLYYADRAFRTNPNPSDFARAGYLVQRGIAYYEFRDRTRAERSFLEALEIYRRLADPRNESLALGELGLLYWTFDRDQARSLEHFEEAIRLARAVKVPGLEAAWLLNSGNVFRDRGEHGEALARYRATLSLEQAGQGSPNLAPALKNIGQVLMRQGQLAEAERYLLEAVAEADRRSRAKFQWEARMELGALFSGRDPARAARYFSESIEYLEAQHSNVLLENFRTGALEQALDRYDPYDLYVDFLLDRGDTNEAFFIAERARARAFLDTLSLAREAIAASVPPSWAAAENEILARISTRQAALRSGSLDEAGVEEARSAIARDETALDELRLRLATEHPELAAARYPRLLRADAVQRELLRDDESLLLFFIGRRSAAAWIVDRNALHLVRLPPRETLDALVRRFVQELSTPDGRPDQGRAAALTEPLLDALARHVPDGRRLIVVPHGILHYLPFEALRGADGRYLIERHDLSYAPSASSLAFLRAPSTSGPPLTRVVAFGNPVTAGGAPAPERSFQIDWIGRLKPLPHTGAELRRVAAVFGSRARVFEREAADEQTLADNLEGAAVLHFATHGLIDEDQPDRSGVALTARPPHSDGILQMREIYRLRMPGALVTLSACQSALGKDVTGEGIVGLTRAFFYAGASTVVAVLWNVNDEAAAQWMGLYYESLRRGATVAEAVRDAKLRYLRSDTRLSHPYYWAPFIASGDGTRTMPGGGRRGLLSIALMGLAAALGAAYLRVRAARRRSAAAQIG